MRRPVQARIATLAGCHRSSATEATGYSSLIPCYRHFTPDPPMSQARPHSPRGSLTEAQIREGAGAELFSLCQGITADGRLSQDEIAALGSWLDANRNAPLPGIASLSVTLHRIVADGHITRDEQRELLEAIEKVLPPAPRRTAKATRRDAEARRKADDLAARKERRRQELERQERRWPEDEFDFLVAGVSFEGRHRTIERCLKAGDRVRILPEPGNPHDECAVAVTLADGRKIGYVPRTASGDVSGCIDDGGYYVAIVKKILTGGRVPVPVILLQFYRPDQRADIADLDPDPCRAASPAGMLSGWLRSLGSWLAWPLLPLLPTARRWASRLVERAYLAGAAAAQWVASVKDDLRAEAGREIHATSLIAKLLVIAALSAASIILLVRFVLFALSLRT